MIELRDIRKSFRRVRRKKGMAAAAAALFRRDYEEIRALDGISFALGRGEIAGFIGPNGAGKSTAIKIMGGILVPDSGECTILETCPWKNRRNYVGRIGVVFGQRTQLWWDVPVRDSLDLLRDIYRVPEGRFRENLGELAALLDLGPLLPVPLRQLSLGQRMRCEIAASLIHDPEILFLDEPTIGLDAVSKLAVRRVIGELNRIRRVTVILTSHDMDDIEALTDRILLIGRGKILYDGPLRKLRERFDRKRRLELSFEAAGGPPPELPEPMGTRLLSRGESRAVWELDTGVLSVSAALRILGEGLSVTDMSAGSRPIEEIIASLYQEGGLG
ncbi:MAG: ATP-binding cassette domain-containing protein [Treponema sp.]|jgi:ABC-2 type transport system ATP-binding protein|nr:ATP-binding cassette domain-containing protein [Treponema sp.]